MKQSFNPASRLKLPRYPFAELELKASRIKASGQQLFDLSIGDPDLPPPAFVVDAVREALNDPRSSRYPSSRGEKEVRRCIADWVKGRFNVEIDHESQVCVLIGAKEGLAQIARAVVNPGDTVAAPEPAYPVYFRAGCQFVEGRLRTLTLDAENDFLPNLIQAAGSKLLYLNYPNNPTGATAPDWFLADLADFVDSEPGLTLAYDMAYSEVCFDGHARSILEFTPRAVEFHSISKMANATGYRVGFAIGDPERIAALIRVKEEIDSGVPLPFQRALQSVLSRYDGRKPPEEISDSMEIYRQRKERLTAAIRHMGFEVFNSTATFYVWFKVGPDETSFVTAALEKGILLTPGSGFGIAGRGWVRASVTTSDQTIDSAIEAMKGIE